MKMLLRIVFLVITWLGARFSKRRAAFAALYHYLRGTGRKFSLSGQKWAREEMRALVTRAQELQEEENPAVTCAWVYSRPGKEVYSLHLNHITGYAGCGFAGREQLFYVLGRFYSKVEDDLATGETHIYGNDPYLWGPEFYADGREFWFSSPVSCPKILWRILQSLFGEQYFTDGADTAIGYRGISNRLWKDLEEVGAKPFQVTWSFRFPEGL